MSNPLVSYSYRVELSLEAGDQTHTWSAGVFQSVSGISSELESVEHRIVQTDAQGSITYEKIPGRPNYTDIVLSRAVYAGDKKFWTWHQNVMEGKDIRVNCSIIAFNTDSPDTVLARWDVVNAWPRKITISEMSADSREVLKEEITLAHGGVTREE